MASLEDIWGPVIPYDEATFKNYLGFQTGYKVENNITQYMEHLISSNIPAYAMINPTEAKAKTDFLLGLATALKNYAVANKIKIVTFVGSDNNWFDITNNVVKIKNKISNKVGKLARNHLYANPVNLPAKQMTVKKNYKTVKSKPKPPPVLPTIPDSNVLKQLKERCVTGTGRKKKADHCEDHHHTEHKKRSKTLQAIEHTTHYNESTRLVAKVQTVIESTKKNMQDIETTLAESKKNLQEIASTLAELLQFSQGRSDFLHFQKDASLNTFTQSLRNEDASVTTDYSTIYGSFSPLQSDTLPSQGVTTTDDSGTRRSP